jgi:hypothetical protein
MDSITSHFVLRPLLNVNFQPRLCDEEGRMVLDRVNAQSAVECCVQKTRDSNIDRLICASSTMAVLRAASSLKASCVSDAQRPSSRAVSVLMAAWTAAVGVLVVPCWIMV